MARKLSASTALTGATVDPANDQLMILDVSDTTDGPGGTNKKITVGPEFFKLFRSYFRNVADTFTSVLQNFNTAPRNYTLQDRDGILADTIVDKAKGSTRDRYISAVDQTVAPATAALSANTLRAHPILITFPTTVDKILCEITTGTTGNWRVGIYSDDGTGYPGALVVDSGQMAVSAPAVFTTTISKVLLPGLYWLAYLTDTANTARTFSFAQHYAAIGFPSTLGATHFNIWSVALAYTALPDPFTAGATPASANMPVIALRYT